MLSFLAKLPYDKALHYVYGSVLFAVCYHLLGTGNSLWAVCIIASGKEIYDYLHRDSHTPDFWDFVATMAGALVCASTLL
jgi:hypothetical protein